ncbi:hypothetical protein GF352_03195 [archaeon]|nr:hypothetical protein [archaeon]
MPTKKELVKKISKKYTKKELKKRVKGIIDFKSSITKKDLLKKISKFKKTGLEDLLKPLKKKVKKEEISISLKPNKWLIPAIGLIILIVVIYSGFSYNPAAPATGIKLIYLTDENCDGCYDVTINEQIVSQYGVEVNIEQYDINSVKGRQLINTYSITKIPSFIIQGESVQDNTQFMSVWSSVGSIANDGTLVFRAPELFLEMGDFKIKDEGGEFVLYEPPEETIGQFIITEDELCTEDGKPIIYFFGSETCIHSSWEHPIINNVTSLFGDEISYHDNMGTQGDSDVFNNYSDIHRGGVPFTIIGCRFIKIGSGESAALDNNTLAELNNTYPSEIAEVSELINASQVIYEEAMAAYQVNDTETLEELSTSYSLLIDNASTIVETLVIRELICNVTNNQPASVC